MNELIFVWQAILAMYLFEMAVHLADLWVCRDIVDEQDNRSPVWTYILAAALWPLLDAATFYLELRGEDEKRSDR